MTSYSVEQKLKLVSALREEQEQNKFSLKKRQAILHGEPFSIGIDSNTKDLSHSESALDAKLQREDDKLHASFWIRFFLAIALFIGFLWYDSSEISIKGVDSTVIFNSIQENQTFPIQALLDSFT